MYHVGLPSNIDVVRPI